MKFITKLTTLVRDIRLVIKHAGYLPKLNDTCAGDTMTLFPEYSVTNIEPTEAPSLYSVLWSRIKGTKRDYTAPWVKTFHPHLDNNDDIEFIFVNGIMTNRDILSYNAFALSELFCRPITVIHNPTYGFAPDIAECVFGRTLDKNVGINNHVLSYVESRLLAGKKVRLIGHSQGGIIVSAVAQMLSELYGEALLADLEVYTFAGAQDELHLPDYVYAEHFANLGDFVARVGVLHFENNISGKLYIRKNARGHLLNTHYLTAFQMGIYCNRQSKLFSYIAC